MGRAFASFLWCHSCREGGKSYFSLNCQLLPLAIWHELDKLYHYLNQLFLTVSWTYFKIYF